MIQSYPHVDSEELAQEITDNPGHYYGAGRVSKRTVTFDGEIDGMRTITQELDVDPFPGVLPAFELTMTTTFEGAGVVTVEAVVTGGSGTHGEIMMTFEPSGHRALWIDDASNFHSVGPDEFVHAWHHAVVTRNVTLLAQKLAAREAPPVVHTRENLPGAGANAASVCRMSPLSVTPTVQVYPHVDSAELAWEITSDPEHYFGEGTVSNRTVKFDGEIGGMRTLIQELDVKPFATHVEPAHLTMTTKFEGVGVITVHLAVGEGHPVHGEVLMRFQQRSGHRALWNHDTSNLHGSLPDMFVQASPLAIRNVTELAEQLAGGSLDAHGSTVIEQP